MIEIAKWKGNLSIFQINGGFCNNRLLITDSAIPAFEDGLKQKKEMNLDSDPLLYNCNPFYYLFDEVQELIKTSWEAEVEVWAQGRPCYYRVRRLATQTRSAATSHTAGESVAAAEASVAPRSPSYVECSSVTIPAENTDRMTMANKQKSFAIRWFFVW